MFKKILVIVDNNLYMRSVYNAVPNSQLPSQEDEHKGSFQLDTYMQRREGAFRSFRNHFDSTVCNWNHFNRERAP